MEVFNLIIQGNSILIIVKIFFLVVSLFFTAFLLVVLRQVLSLSALVNDVNDTVVLKIFAIILLLFSVSLFLTSLVIL